ncbi:hypothetical protein [Natrononativus amylolyticus]|uniref:hypothetical protein n=1 Tax=Natrononativus amylolyticus TaxID=2963434 RepID=UPI0020CD4758|nr:hypothetical protein [Natrononativus amylolyticus]
MTETAWDRLCEYEFAFRILSVLVFALGVLTLFSFPYIERGTAEYTVATYNLLVITAFILVILAVRANCR